ncbi:MAG: DUF4189 domain-containing protein [Novosphingobium sp.]|nr:DUF4189 domain-containing protein [Novosphingobium sp.]
MGIKFLPFALAFLVSLIAASSPASAQSCPAGYFVIGGPGAYGCAPIPGSGSGDSSSGDDQSVTNIRIDSGTHYSHAVMVWHADLANVWIDGGIYFTKLSSETEKEADRSAGTRALAACNKMMGGGCTVAWEWWDSDLVMFRRHNGEFLIPAQSRVQLELNECSAAQALPCEGFHIDAGYSRLLNEGARKLYAVSAWVEGPVTDNKLYVASGHRSLDDAAAAAIKACSTATSRKCEVAEWVGSGFLQTFRLNGDSFGVTAETTAERAKEAAKAICKKHNSPTCELQAQFDSKKPGLFVHDFKRAGAQ